jgi:pimeloyl-ACP methyl ester carboxylesterase
MYAMGERRPDHPTVILEAGHSDWSHCWPRVQPEIARVARVVAYDRAGFGWSDPGPRPRTPLRLVTELHSLLERSGEQGPYIFVGHSLGAALGRLFTAQYPDEVVGMIWVDSAHEHMQRYIPFWNSAYYGLVASGHLGAALARTGLVRRVGRKLMLDNTPLAQSPEDQAELVAQMGAPKFFETMRDETLGWYPPENWARRQKSLSDLPIIMIEAQYPPKPLRWYPPRQYREFCQGWVEIQTELSRLSTRTQRVPVVSGHNVMHERPEVIIQAVQDMFDMLGYDWRSP